MLASLTLSLQDREPDETMSVAGSVRHQRRNSVATTTSDNTQDPYMAALVDSRCLSICISLLERVNGVSTPDDSNLDPTNDVV
jgi:hypothetical protein